MIRKRSPWSENGLDALKMDSTIMQSYRDAEIKMKMEMEIEMQ